MYRPLSVYLGLRYGTARQGTPLVAFLSRVSAVGLALSVALLILVLAVMNGFDREMRDRILALVPQASLYQFGGMDDWQSLAGQAEAHPEVLAAAPYSQLQAMVVAADKARAVLARAVLPGHERRVSAIDRFMIEGRFDDLGDEGNRIVLSRIIADELNVGLGDSVALVVPAGGAGVTRLAPQLHAARVAGIYDSSTEVDNLIAYIPLGFGLAIEGAGARVQGLRLQVADLMRAGEVARELVEQLPRGYYSGDWMRSHGNLFEAIQLSKRLVTFMVFIIIAVAAFNVVTAMIMVVRDKRGDVAILQTMGLSQREIMQLFVFQGLVIGVIGTGAGAALGLLLASQATALVQWLELLLDYQFLKSEVYPVTYLPVDIRWRDVVQVCGTACGLSVLAALHPAWRASRALPAEVLRYDR